MIGQLTMPQSEFLASIHLKIFRKFLVKMLLFHGISFLKDLLLKTSIIGVSFITISVSYGRSVTIIGSTKLPNLSIFLPPYSAIFD